MRVQDLAPIAIAFVVVAIVMGVGADVLDGIQGQTNDKTSTYQNETTPTFDDATNTSQLNNKRCVSVTECWNETGANQLVSSSNYTVSSTGLITVNNSAIRGFPWDGESWNCTYTGCTDSTAYNASEYGLEGIQTLAEWLPTIALVIAAAVVIGVIVTYFMFRTGVR